MIALSKITCYFWNNFIHTSNSNPISNSQFQSTNNRNIMESCPCSNCSTKVYWVKHSRRSNHSALTNIPFNISQSCFYILHFTFPCKLRVKMMCCRTKRIAISNIIISYYQAINRNFMFFSHIIIHPIKNFRKFFKRSIFIVGPRNNFEMQSFHIIQIFSKRI